MFLRIFLILLAFTAVAQTVQAGEASGKNRYEMKVLVATEASSAPAIGVDKNLVNAWGIAIRPAGAGGHFWVNARDASYEYIGDVLESVDEALKVLHQDNLKMVKLPVGGSGKFATGAVYSDSKENFIIQQEINSLESITQPAKFLFASDGGIISAWTERKKQDGSFDRPDTAKTVIDNAAAGSQFFGLALSGAYDRLYAADFGKNPSVAVFDGKFNKVPLQFPNPFDTNHNRKVDAGEYAPFNIQLLRTPAGENHLFVTYAMTKSCPAEEIAKSTCEKGGIFPGEEDTSRAGLGRLAEFTEDGHLVMVWGDNGKLSAPWGLAFAPEGFGALSGKLLVANFGDGTIAAFDAKTHNFTDFVKDRKGNPLVIDKIWGLVFGNGASLGDKNALYFTAGPNDEKDGMFGSIRIAADKY